MGNYGKKVKQVVEKTPAAPTLKNVFVVEDSALFCDNGALNLHAVTFLHNVLRSSSQLIIIGTRTSVDRRRCLLALSLVGLTGFTYAAVGDISVKQGLGDIAYCNLLKFHAPYGIVAKDNEKLIRAVEVLKGHQGTLILMKASDRGELEIVTAK